MSQHRRAHAVNALLTRLSDTFTLALLALFTGPALTIALMLSVVSNLTPAGQLSHCVKRQAIGTPDRHGKGSVPGEVRR